MAQMPAYRSRYGDTITDLLSRRGDIAAAGALRSGDIWGSTVGNLGAIAGQAVQGYAQAQQEKKKAEEMKARDMAIAEVFNSDAVNDPPRLYGELLKRTDPMTAMKLSSGWVELKKLSQTKDDPQKALASLPVVAEAFEALPEAMRADAWTGLVRPALISSGVAKAEGLMEQYNPEQAASYIEFAKRLKTQQKPQGEVIETIGPDGVAIKRRVSEQELAKGVPVYKKPEDQKAPWGQPFTGPDGVSYQKHEQTGEIRRTPGVGGKPAETPAELVLNPEGVVLSSYGPKQKNEVRRQAMERGLPVFENQAAQSKGVVLAGIVDDAKELAGLLEQDEVRAAIGPLAGRWAQLKAKAFDLPPKVQRAIQLMTSLSDTELRKRSGAQINEKEMERLLRFTTDPNKPLGHNITAVEGLWSSGARDYKALSGMDLGQPPVVPQIKDEAEYNALPAGAVYIDPNGKRRRKGVQ